MITTYTPGISQATYGHANALSDLRLTTTSAKRACTMDRSGDLRCTTKHMHGLGTKTLSVT